MSGLLATLPLHLACQLIEPSDVSYVNVTITQEEPPAPNHTTIVPGGYAVFPDIRVAYKYYKNPLTWDSARKLCLTEGASLAIVDSYKKVNYIMDLKDKTQGTWTGIHKLFDNTEWTNIKTGQPVGFLPWRPDAKTHTGSCVVNGHDTLGVTPWQCDELVPVVCEIPLL